MTTEKGHPTRDELLAMAYVDDEMTQAERREFEQLLTRDAKLAAEVAEFRCLADLTRAVQVAEPADHEIRRFWEGFYNRSEWQLGWGLLIFGSLIAGGYGIYRLLAGDLPVVIKLASVTALAGAAMLFFSTLRQKLRTQRLDRYRGVLR